MNARVGGPQAPPGRVEVFVVPIEPPGPATESLLSQTEHRRASGMRSEAARHQFVSLRACLRLAMAERLGCTPQSVAIEVDPGGAPMSPGSGWYFSLSHAASAGVVALSRGGPIGIDIEPIQPISEVMQVARTVFHPSECEWISRHRPEARSTAFLQVWVRKEAVMKATGKGMARSPDAWSLLTTPRGIEPRLDVELDGQVWRVQELAAPRGHLIALATRCGDADIRLRQLPTGNLRGLPPRDET